MTKFFLIFAFFSSSAFAGDLSLDFKDVPINTLVHSIIKHVLKQDYVITPEAASAESKLTLSVKGLDREGVKQTLNETLNSVGLQLDERRGVLYVEKRSHSSPAVAESPASPPSVAAQFPALGLHQQYQNQNQPAEGEEPQVYFPKYRNSEYLSLAVRAAGARLITNQVNIQQSSYAAPGSVFPQMMQQQPIQQNAQQPVTAGQASSSLFRDVLVFTGKPVALAKAAALLEKLDRPTVAVQLRGAILEITDGADKIRSFSAALNILGQKVGFDISSGLTASNSAFIRTSSLNVIAAAVDGDSRFRYLSEPSLRVLEGETAKLTVGQEVPTRGAVQTDKNGNSLQSIEYRTSGLVFDVTPTVYDSVLRLKIAQQVSNFINTTTSGIDSPTLLKREASTVIQAHDGELIAIAGLDESRESDSSSGLSFLPSFLHGKSATRSKSQILLLLEVTRVKPSLEL